MHPRDIFKAVESTVKETPAYAAPGIHSSTRNDFLEMQEDRLHDVVEPRVQDTPSEEEVSAGVAIVNREV